MTSPRRNQPATKLPGRRGPGHRRRKAVILLEVVLAMMLFFGGALVILAGLSSSLTGIQRVQIEAQATDLAVTLLSEVQMGVVQLVSDGPTGYEDPALAKWTWQIAVEPYEEQQLELELPEFQRVEVTIRHEPTGYANSLTILMTDEPPDEGPELDAGPGITIPGGGGGGQ
jgi:hypothetical protein